MIGIYGGTFDPVHFGHLRTALEVKEMLQLDEVRLIPCSQPPHRDQPSTPATMRLQMLQLAIAGQTGLQVDDRELSRPGYSYMVDTLRSLRQELAGRTLLLLMGVDAFNGLTSWHRWQQLFDYAHIMVMTRPGYPLPELDSFMMARQIQSIEPLRRQSAGYLYFQPVIQLDISASKIRHQIAQQLSVDFLLPEPVIQFIKQHNLYQI